MKQKIERAHKPSKIIKNKTSLNFKSLNLKKTLINYRNSNSYQSNNLRFLQVAQINHQDYQEAHLIMTESIKETNSP